MAFAKIGIMSIGEMGYHWAKLLKARGAEVLTYDRDRSPVTQRRAENAGVEVHWFPGRTVLERGSNRLDRGAIGGTQASSRNRQGRGRCSIART